MTGSRQEALRRNICLDDLVDNKQELTQHPNNNKNTDLACQVLEVVRETFQPCTELAHGLESHPQTAVLEQPQRCLLHNEAKE